MRVFLSKPRTRAIIAISLISLFGLLTFQNCAPQRLQSEIDTMVNGASQSTTNSRSSVPGLVDSQNVDPRSITSIPGLITPTPPVTTPSPIPIYGGGPNGTVINPTPTPTPGGGSLGCPLTSAHLNSTYSAASSDLTAQTQVIDGVRYLKPNAILNTSTSVGLYRESCRDYYQRKTNSAFEIGQNSSNPGARREFNGAYVRTLRCSGTGLLISESENVVEDISACPAYCLRQDEFGRTKYYFVGDYAKNVTQYLTGASQSGRCRISTTPYTYYGSINYQCQSNAGRIEWVRVNTAPEYVTTNVNYERLSNVVSSSTMQTLMTTAGYNVQANDLVADFIRKNSTSLVDPIFSTCSSGYFTQLTMVQNNGVLNSQFGPMHGSYRIQNESATPSYFFINQEMSALYYQIYIYGADQSNLTLVGDADNLQFVGSGYVKPDGCSNFMPYDAIIRKQTADHTYSVELRQRIAGCGIAANFVTSFNIVREVSASNLSPTPRYSEVSCNSVVDEQNECPAGGNITDVNLITASGGSTCVKNQTYGFSGTSVWVSNGCSGSFRVQF